MQITNLTLTNLAKPLWKTFWIGAIAASLSTFPLLPASAQTNTAPGVAPDTTTDIDDDDDGFDWGWLGLLGLIGLAGLKRKPEDRTRYPDPVNTTTTRSDYRQ
jgi:hypothetical protein